MKKLYVLAFIPFCLLAVSACSSTPASSPGVTACTGAPSGSYRIGRGDVLQLSVWKNKNLDRVATVRPDGMISFPLIHGVQAAGLTPMQLQEALTKKLQNYITDPQVSVVVQKIEGSTASVLGEVNHPGSYTMTRGATTVLDMLAQAGGLTDFADRGNISVLRKAGDGKTRRLHFNYGEATSQNPGAADFCMQPGDIVVVH